MTEINLSFAETMSIFTIQSIVFIFVCDEMTSSAHQHRHHSVITERIIMMKQEMAQYWNGEENFILMCAQLKHKYVYKS